MRERAHVALRERVGGRHRVSVGEERSSRAWGLGDGDHFGDAFAQRQHASRSATARPAFARGRDPTAAGAQAAMAATAMSMATTASAGIGARRRRQSQRHHGKCRRGRKRRGGALDAERRAAGESRSSAIRRPPRPCSTRYRTPARRPTGVSARWTIAFASGKPRPISSAGMPAPSRIGPRLNHSSRTRRACRRPQPALRGGGSDARHGWRLRRRQPIRPATKPRRAPARP